MVLKSLLLSLHVLCLSRALQANPGLRAQFPRFMRQMADPQNLRAMTQMQAAMQQLQRAGILLPGSLGGMPGMMPGGGIGGTGTGDGAGGLGPGLAGLSDFGNLNLGRGESPFP